MKAASTPAAERGRLGSTFSNSSHVSPMVHTAEDHSQYTGTHHQECEIPHSNALIFSAGNFEFELKELVDAEPERDK